MIEVGQGIQCGASQNADPNRSRSVNMLDTIAMSIAMFFVGLLTLGAINDIRNMA